METLEQYGIKDVTPGKGVGCSERLRGVYSKDRYILEVWMQDSFRAMLFGAKYTGIVTGGQYQYANDGASVWLDEVRYN